MNKYNRNLLKKEEKSREIRKRGLSKSEYHAMSVKASAMLQQAQQST